MRSLFYSLSDELLPSVGSAESVAGELIRAVSYITYQNYNNGNTVSRASKGEAVRNAQQYAIDTLKEIAPITNEETANQIIDKLKPLSWVYAEDNYNKLTEEIILMVAEFIDHNKELKEMKNEKDAIYYTEPEKNLDDTPVKDKYSVQKPSKEYATQDLLSTYNKNTEELLYEKDICVFHSDQSIYDHFSKEYLGLLGIKEHAISSVPIENAQRDLERIVSSIQQEYGTVYQTNEEGNVVESSLYDTLWNIIEPAIIIKNFRKRTEPSLGYTDEKITHLFYFLRTGDPIYENKSISFCIDRLIEILHKTNN